MSVMLWQHDNSGKSVPRDRPLTIDEPFLSLFIGTWLGLESSPLKNTDIPSPSPAPSPSHLPKGPTMEYVFHGPTKKGQWG